MPVKAYRTPHFNDYEHPLLSVSLILTHSYAKPDPSANSKGCPRHSLALLAVEGWLLLPSSGHMYFPSSSSLAKNASRN